MGQLAHPPRLFIFGVLVAVQEHAKLAVIFLLGLLDWQHGLKLGLERLQVLLEHLLVSNKFQRFLKEDLDVALLVFLPTSLTQNERRSYLVWRDTVSEQLNMFDCLESHLHLVECFGKVLVRLQERLKFF